MLQPACMLRLISTGPKSPYMYSRRFEIRIPSGPETLQLTETLISLADVFSVIRTACLLGGSGLDATLVHSTVSCLGSSICLARCADPHPPRCQASLAVVAWAAVRTATLGA